MQGIVPTMLVARVVSIAYGMPPVKRLLWRRWYEFLAHRYRDWQWTFMNYRHRPPYGTMPLALAPEGEPARSCIQLYNPLASAVGRIQYEIPGGGPTKTHVYVRRRTD
jgi:hypothetical protein